MQKPWGALAAAGVLVSTPGCAAGLFAFALLFQSEVLSHFFCCDVVVGSCMYMWTLGLHVTLSVLLREFSGFHWVWFDVFCVVVSCFQTVLDQLCLYAAMPCVVCRAAVRCLLCGCVCHFCIVRVLPAVLFDG